MKITIPKTLEEDFHRAGGLPRQDVKNHTITIDTENSVNDLLKNIENSDYHTQIAKINLAAFLQNQIKPDPAIWQRHNIMIRSILAENDPRIDKSKKSLLKMNEAFIRKMISGESEEDKNKLMNRKLKEIQFVESALTSSHAPIEKTQDPRQYPSECRSFLEERIRYFLDEVTVEEKYKQDFRIEAQKIIETLKKQGFYNMDWYRMRPAEFFQDLQKIKTLDAETRLGINLIWAYCDTKNIIAQDHLRVRSHNTKASSETQEILKKIENYLNPDLKAHLTSKTWFKIPDFIKSLWRTLRSFFLSANASTPQARPSFDGVPQANPMLAQEVIPKNRDEDFGDAYSSISSNPESETPSKQSTLSRSRA